MTKSRYFLLSCVSFIFGIVLGSFISIQIWILFLIVGFSISLIFLFKDSNVPLNKGGWGVNENNSVLFGSKNLLIFFLIFIVFFSFGFIRIEINKLSTNEIISIESLDGQKILLKGKILQSPEIKNGKQKILLGKIVSDNFRNELLESGKMIVYLERYPEYNIGDEISFKGKLNVPEDFDGFEYKNYLFAQGIFFVEYYPKVELLKKADEDICIKIANYRKSASEIVKKIFSQPQAGIINAMVLGKKSDLSNETLENFNRTGTRHIIAISGLHMTIIGVLVMFLLLAIGLNRSFAFYLAVLGIGFYVMLVGFPPSAVRASVMSVMILLAVKVGRLSSAGIAIIFAGSLMLVFNPNLLRYDTGFQLSFLAVLGIIYIYPKLDFYLKKYPDYLKIKTIFLITVSAQIATLPIIISNFGQFSVFSVFANIMILPFVPIVMIGGIISIMAGFVSLLIGQIIAIPVWLILSLQLYIIKTFAGFEIGFFSFENISVLFGVVYYGVLIFFLNLKDIKNKFR
ncbi:MAG: ComEC/Rec2 family competence protein [Candidatus Pacebacteria bacterium]|nr:ComEC/Rec2 family competence protein [Candidatus Paceibacterota bacterium]